MKGQGKFQKIKGGGVGGGCIHAVFVVVVCFLSWWQLKLKLFKKALKWHDMFQYDPWTQLW